MVEIKAKVNGDRVDASTQFDGTGIELVAECCGAIDAMHDGLKKHGLHKFFLVGLRSSIEDWLDESEGGENLA